MIFLSRVSYLLPIALNAFIGLEHLAVYRYSTEVGEVLPEAIDVARKSAIHLVGSAELSVLRSHLEGGANMDGWIKADQSPETQLFPRVIFKNTALPPYSGRLYSPGSIETDMCEVCDDRAICYRNISHPSGARCACKDAGLSELAELEGDGGVRGEDFHGRSCYGHDTLTPLYTKQAGVVSKQLQRYGMCGSVPSCNVYSMPISITFEGDGGLRQWNVSLAPLGKKGGADRKTWSKQQWAYLSPLEPSPSTSNLLTNTVYPGNVSARSGKTFRVERPSRESHANIVVFVDVSNLRQRSKPYSLLVHVEWQNFQLGDKSRRGRSSVQLDMLVQRSSCMSAHSKDTLCPTCWPGERLIAEHEKRIPPPPEATYTRTRTHARTHACMHNGQKQIGDGGELGNMSLFGCSKCDEEKLAV